MSKVEKKSLELAIAALDKEFGKNTIFRGNYLPESVDVISTGNFKLDLALGVGGLPKGRIVEIFGAEALGKSLLSLSTAAECQKAGGTVGYIDAECDLDPTWASKLGVDMDDMYICQPDYGEVGLEVADKLIKTGEIDLLIIDSVAALVPKAELDGSMEDNHIGLQARMMAQALRKIRHSVSETNTCLVFINQIRDKIGFMQQGTTSPGGRSLKFAASVRIELKNMGIIKDAKNNNEPRGTRVKATVLRTR
jgi:recombination protein RecA